MRFFFRLSLLLALLSASVTAQQVPPKLIVFISVDQLKGNVFDRYGSLFNGGLKRLMNEGVRYAHADLNYAPSETGPGHATMATGCYPWKHGIVGNNWKDRATRAGVYCVSDSSVGASESGAGGVSPKNLKVTAIGDWIRERWPSATVITLSLKDRAAILMGGKHPNLVLWGDRGTDRMVSDRYYVQQLPEWVKEFNDSIPGKYLPDAWTPVPVDSLLTFYCPDEMPGEAIWGTGTTFPHPFTKKKFIDQLAKSPFGNDMLLDLAEKAMQAEQLGRHEAPDLLCVSLSSTDGIGHAFGQDSREMVDNFVRLDRRLGKFLDAVEAFVGRGRVLVALTADHGSLPLPEYMNSIHPGMEHRIDPDEWIIPASEALDSTLMVLLKTKEHVIRRSGDLNVTAAERAGVSLDSLEGLVRKGLCAIDGIEDVYFRSEFLSGKPVSRPYGETMRHGYDADRGKDFLLRFCEGCLLTGSKTGTSHGSPYMYDTHVPLVIWGAGVPARVVDRLVHTVDVAPTLARSVDANPPAGIDGVVLKEIVRQ